MAANAVRAAEAILDGLPIRAVDTTVEKLPSLLLLGIWIFRVTGRLLEVSHWWCYLKARHGTTARSRLRGRRIATAQELLGLAEQYLEGGDSSRAAITFSIGGDYCAFDQKVKVPTTPSSARNARGTQSWLIA